MQLQPEPGGVLLAPPHVSLGACVLSPRAIATSASTSQSKQRSTGILFSSSSLPSALHDLRARSTSPASNRDIASAQPGPPPPAGIVAPAIRPPTCALSSAAAIAPSRSPAW